MPSTRENRKIALARAPAHRELPAGWPDKGELDGKEIDLRKALDTMDSRELARIIVAVPGFGPSQPWKGSDVGIDTETGEVLL